MKFLNIKLYPEYIKQDKVVGQEFFSLINPIIEFILNINITNNNDNINNPDNKVSILFNYQINNPVLNFKLENIYAQIKCNFIEFKRNVDNAYFYKFLNDGEEYSKIIYIN